jgi:DNA-binding transcriptional ArsR family regulator
MNSSSRRVGPPSKPTIDPSVITDNRISASAFRTYAFLIERAEPDYSASVFLNEFCDALGAGETTIQTHLTELRAAGIIQTRRQGRGKPLFFLIRQPGEKTLLSAVGTESKYRAVSISGYFDSVPVADAPFSAGQDSDPPNLRGLVPSDPPKMGDSPPDPPIGISYNMHAARACEASPAVVAAAAGLKNYGVDEFVADELAIANPMLVATWLAELPRRRKQPDNPAAFLVGVLRRNEPPFAPPRSAPHLRSVPSAPIVSRPPAESKPDEPTAAPAADILGALDEFTLNELRVQAEGNFNASAIGRMPLKESLREKYILGKMVMLYQEIQAAG